MAEAIKHVYTSSRMLITICHQLSNTFGTHVTTRPVNDRTTAATAVAWWLNRLRLEAISATATRQRTKPSKVIRAAHLVGLEPA